MMKDFILEPWEYRTPPTNPKAHAEARLEIGGKKRDFLLKLREGVIYFKESGEFQVFAILEHFEDALAEDPIGLISAFHREAMAGNYAAFYTKHDYFPNLPVSGYFMLLVRADGTGWMREHFDANWSPLPDWGRPLAMNMWGGNLRLQILINILPTVKEVLLQRIISPELRFAESPRWIGGDSKDITSLITAAARLFPSSPSGVGANEPFTLGIKSHSIFDAHGIGPIWWHNTADSDGYWGKLIQLMKKQFQFVGVDWLKGGDEKEMPYHPRIDSFFQEGLQQWGEDWRGNWAPRHSRFEISVPGLTNISAHEKLESALLLRNWLKGKMSISLIEELFRGTNLN